MDTANHKTTYRLSLSLFGVENLHWYGIVYWYTQTKTLILVFVYTQTNTKLSEFGIGMVFGI